MNAARYEDIPESLRAILADVYLPEGVVYWWINRNTMLDGKAPQDAWDAAPAGHERVILVAQILADGNL